MSLSHSGDQMTEKITWMMMHNGTLNSARFVIISCTTSPIQSLKYSEDPSPKMMVT